jgi:hypothetical protein
MQDAYKKEMKDWNREKERSRSSKREEYFQKVG